MGSLTSLLQIIVFWIDPSRTPVQSVKILWNTKILSKNTNKEKTMRVVWAAESFSSSIHCIIHLSCKLYLRGNWLLNLFHYPIAIEFDFIPQSSNNKGLHNLLFWINTSVSCPFFSRSSSRRTLRKKFSCWKNIEYLWAWKSLYA